MPPPDSKPRTILILAFGDSTKNGRPDPKGDYHDNTAERTARLIPGSLRAQLPPGYEIQVEIIPVDSNQQLTLRRINQALQKHNPSMVFGLGELKESYESFRARIDGLIGIPISPSVPAQPIIYYEAQALNQFSDNMEIKTDAKTRSVQLSFPKHQKPRFVVSGGPKSLISGLTEFTALKETTPVSDKVSAENGSIVGVPGSNIGLCNAMLYLSLNHFINALDEQSASAPLGGAMFAHLVRPDKPEKLAKYASQYAESLSRNIQRAIVVDQFVADLHDPDKAKTIPRAFSESITDWTNPRQVGAMAVAYRMYRLAQEGIVPWKPEEILDKLSRKPQEPEEKWKRRVEGYFGIPIISLEHSYRKSSGHASTNGTTPPVAPVPQP